MFSVCSTAQISTHDALQAARRALIHLPEPALEAELLVALALKTDRVGLRRDAERRLTKHDKNVCEALIAARVRGVPFAYLSGKQEFWSLDFAVDARVLVPRSETELLVSLALAEIELNPSPRIADLGTGSGAVAVALAHELPHARIIAVDREFTVLQVAQRNATVHRCNNIRFVQAHWCTALAADRFDIIVANPPYIRDDDPALECDGVRFEPRTALAAGSDGLRDLTELARFSPRALRTNGCLMVEHGNTQGAAVRALFSQSGLGNVMTHRDFSGHERVTAGRKSES